MPRVVRLLLLIFSLIVNLSFAEEIDISVYFKGASRAREIFKSTNALVKKINADNKFVQANFKEIDCADNEIEICKEVEENVIVKFTESAQPSVSSQISIDPSEEDTHKASIFRGLVDFSSVLFKSRALIEDDTRWWELPSNDLNKKIEEVTIHTEGELAEFGKNGKKDHNILVFFKIENFENLLAVHSSIQAAKEAKTLVGLINCETTPNLCKGKENLPLIVDMYLQKETKVFEGIPSSEKVADWIRTLRLPVITQLKEDTVPLYRNGQIPGFTSARETVTLLFSPNKTNEPYKIYQRFAQENHGKYHLTALVDKGVYKWPHHPAFITTKPYERVSQAFVLFEGLTEERIVDFLRTGGNPVIHYLTDGAAADFLFSTDLPIFFFYDPSGKVDATEFAKLAAEHPLRWQVASFAAISGKNLFGIHMANELGLVEEKPLYAVYDRKENCLHTQKIGIQTKDELEKWLKENLGTECESKVVLDTEVYQRIHLWERKERFRKLLQEVHQSLSFHEEL